VQDHDRVAAVGARRPGLLGELVLDPGGLSGIDTGEQDVDGVGRRALRLGRALALRDVEVQVEVELGDGADLVVEIDGLRLLGGAVGVGVSCSVALNAPPRAARSGPPI
jgi:hypothetical protein